jgi:prevent-host-death family protein
MERKVGVRDAKARLSQILKDVQRGQQWTITDHGRPVALLTPPPSDSLSLQERLQRLVDRGWIDQPRRDQRTLPPPLPLEPGVASTWLREDRDRGL